MTRNMMGNSGETILPFHTCKRNMVNDFSAFFYNKILNIRSELGLPGLYKCGSMTTSFSGTPLTTFMNATEVEIRNIIKLSPAKSCELDLLPTWLLKECIAELVPTITDIVNMLLRDFLMPKLHKTALIRLLLNKTGLDSDIYQERLRDHDSMSRALIGLHWFRVDKRIEYNLLLYTYKALHDLASGYL